MALGLIGIAIGAFITWLVAKYYYERASRDLASEAKELKKLNILMLRGLEASGLVKFSRDDEGNIKGTVINGNMENLQIGTTSVNGNGTVIQKKEK